MTPVFQMLQNKRWGEGHAKREIEQGDLGELAGMRGRCKLDGWIEYPLDAASQIAQSLRGKKWECEKVL